MSKQEKDKLKYKDTALVVFKPADGITEYQVILGEDKDTLWASELQIAELFGRDRTVINRHIRNLFKDGELDEVSTSAKIAQVQKEGDREIKRQIKFYNLDIIIAVGYRVNSKRGTEFRIWANKIIKDFLITGFSRNARRCS